MKAGKEAASTVMPLMSSALYLGQFLSPLVVSPLAELLYGASDLLSPYKVGVLIAVLYLLQACMSRKKHLA